MGTVVNGCCENDDKTKNKPQQCSPTKKQSSSIVSPPLHKSYSSVNKLCESTAKAYDSTNISSVRSLNVSPAKQNGGQAEEYEGRDYLRIDDFIVRGHLGSGNFGSVYLVQLKTSQQSGEKLALKKINKSGFTNKKVQQSTMLQKIVMAKLNNPFLTSLKFSFADDKFVYLAMEYAVGGPVESLLCLREIQDKKNMRPRKFKELGDEGIRFIAGCVVLGLEHLHQNNIIYRDLKPQNLIIFKDGYVKLTDFGLAKILDNRDEARTEVGTILYFAPQMVLKKGYSRQVDLWQLGVLLYQMATSKSPFRKDEILMRSRFKDIVMQFQKSSKWKDNTLSEQLRDLIIRLLKFNPKDRLGSQGFTEIKKHAFFQPLDWTKLSDKQLASPLLRIIEGHPLKIREVRRNDFQHCQWKKEVKSDPEWSYDYRSLN